MTRILWVIFFAAIAMALAAETARIALLMTAE